MHTFGSSGGVAYLFLVRRMKPPLVLAMSLLSFLFGCSREKLVEGGFYYTPAEKGGYHVLKILKLDERGVHVRLYSNRFPSPPTRVDENTLYLATVHQPEEDPGLGHLPASKETFASWKAVFIQQSTVKPEELDGYEEWKNAKGGYW
jgi:hypothetical protein